MRSVSRLPKSFCRRDFNKREREIEIWFGSYTRQSVIITLFLKEQISTKVPEHLSKPNDEGRSG